MYKKLFFLAVLGLMTPFAKAGEIASREILGFSKNGHYMAWQESWNPDETSEEICKIYFVDTKNNSWTSDPLSKKWDHEGEVATKDLNICSELQKEALPVLKKLEIDFNQHAYPAVYHSIMEVFPPTQNEILPTAPTEKVRFNLALGPSIGLFEREFADLILQQKKFKSGLSDEALQMVTVTLKIRDEKRVLQNDKTLPDSRKELMPLYYRIGEVHLYEPAIEKDDMVIVVFLDMFVNAYEGPSRRTLAITGSLPAGFRLNGLKP